MTGIKNIGESTKQKVIFISISPFAKFENKALKFNTCVYVHAHTCLSVYLCVWYDILYMHVFFY